MFLMEDPYCIDYNGNQEKSIVKLLRIMQNLPLVIMAKPLLSLMDMKELHQLRIIHIGGVVRIQVLLLTSPQKQNLLEKRMHFYQGIATSRN